MVLERNDDKGERVPNRVGDDECGQVGREETIEKSPKRTDDKRRHDEHEIERWDVDRGIDKRGDDEARIGSEAAGEVALSERAPKDFFCRSNDEEQQETHDGGVVVILHGVDEIDLRTREGKQELREFVTNPEDAPKGECHADAYGQFKQDSFGSGKRGFNVKQPRRKGKSGEGGEDDGTDGHGTPKRKQRLGGWRKHDEPKCRGK